MRRPAAYAIGRMLNGIAIGRMLNGIAIGCMLNGNASTGGVSVGRMLNGIASTVQRSTHGVWEPGNGLAQLF